MLMKTRYWPMMLTVVCVCGLMPTVSRAASLTPYANGSASKDRKAGSQRCLEVTRQAPGEGAVFLNHKSFHDFLPYTDLCVERYDPGGKANQLESATILLLHAASSQPLSGFGCGPGLDCSVQSLGDPAPLSRDSLFLLSTGAAPAKDEQSTALWDPAGGETAFDPSGGDHVKSLLDEDRFVPVRLPPTALSPAPEATMWDRALHFGLFLLLLLERLRGRL